MFRIVDKTKILLTRGDDAFICLPITRKQYDPIHPSKPRVTKYYVGDNESVRVQVRKAPVISDALPELMFDGLIDIQEGVPVWHISSENSTIDVKEYFWDAELTTEEGLKFTYLQGTLEILPEETV